MKSDRSLPARPSPASPAPDVDVVVLQRLLPPHRVILHNDDHNTMDFVVNSLRACVPSLNRERAVEIMLQAHNHGRATVIVCPKEAAEHYRACLQGRGLTATMEAA